MRRAKLRRFFRIAAAYLLVAILAALGWLWRSLPSEILLEPGQSLFLPRFSFIEPHNHTVQLISRISAILLSCHNT